MSQNTLFPDLLPAVEEETFEMLDVDNQVQYSQYLTPSWFPAVAVECEFPELSASDFVLEPTCGRGAWLDAIPDHVPALGVEIDPDLAAFARERTGRNVLVGDFLTVELPDVRPSLILGNPPFDLSGFFDKMLDRAYDLLTPDGRIGMLLPVYFFQTAKRVTRYNEKWSIRQQLVPRNLYHGLRLPLCFAVMAKEAHGPLVGFAYYHETSAVHRLPERFREILESQSKSVWLKAVAFALHQLGGEASIDEVFRAMKIPDSTKNRFPRAKVRQTLRRYGSCFEPVRDDYYRIKDAA